MSNDTVRFIVDLSIHDGKVGEFERVAQAMCASSQNESGTLAYSWYLSDDRKRCRLIETYTDADAAFAHLTGPVVKELVPQLLASSKVAAFEVYGDPGHKATEILMRFGAEIFKPWLGFNR
jgi:quinol monooxygenase YgiN